MALAPYYDTNPDVYIGRELLENGLGGEKFHYEEPLHLMLFGPNGVGKGMRLLAPNLLTIKGRSIVVIDPKGQLAAMTAKFRHEIGDVVRIIDPFGELASHAAAHPDRYRDLIRYGLIESHGFNPLASLDPESRTFYDDAAVVAEALIKIYGTDPHWTESAQGLVAGLLMWDRLEYGQRATLGHVRHLLTEADEWGQKLDAKGKPILDRNGKPVEELKKGLRVTAAHMVERGNFAIASLAGRFSAEHYTDEVESIRSSADTQTRWLLSEPIRKDLTKNGVDFSALKSRDRAMTVYIILPPEYLETHSVWLRLVISDALRACMTPGGRRVLFMLDEIAALGHLSIVERLFSVTRDYRVQMWQIWQDLVQLKQIYDKRWSSFLANAGIIQSFRVNDSETADWMSRRSPATTVTALGYQSGRSDGQGGPGQNNSFSYNQVERPTIRPHDLYGLPDDLAVVWFAGAKNPALLKLPHVRQMVQTYARALKNPFFED